uniref:ATP synthase peripheral stalk subunit F6, mitochondrial n=1 Tax=Sinocyclocheilus anshuiensis TaxID=1608454 RepID=A0A671M775_9TELE
MHPPYFFVDSYLWEITPRYCKCFIIIKFIIIHRLYRISFTSAEQLDSIQRLFLDKLREYSTKSQASGGPVDAGPEYEKALSEELTKLQRLYGSGDLTNGSHG